MASDEWLRRLESEARARRNAEREHQQERAEHLRSLNDEERSAFLAAEREAQEAAQRIAAEHARRQEEEMRREQRDAAERYRRERPRVVLEIWQSLRGHRLSSERRAEFFTRPEIEELSSFDDENLGVTGRRAMAEDDGDLLLTRWLEEARERDRKARIRDEVPWWNPKLPPG
jgi:hypothetical protein